MPIRRRTAALVIGLAALLIGACGDDDGASVREVGPRAGSGSGSGSGSASASGTGSGSGSASGPAAECHVEGGTTAAATTQVEVRLDEWRMALSKTGVKAGNVELVALNRGHELHEVVVIKDVAPDDLPMDEHGAVVEQQLPPGALVGEIEAFAAGGTCEGTFDLQPGVYTLVCNVVEGAEAHAKLGMVATLTVSA